MRHKSICRKQALTVKAGTDYNELLGCLAHRIKAERCPWRRQEHVLDKPGIKLKGREIMTTQARLEYKDIKSFARWLREEYAFSSEEIPPAEGKYVAWIDLMGSGHTMSVSVHKSANFLMRLHMVVQTVCEKHSFKGDRLAINDGIYLISDDKVEILTVVRDVMAHLSLLFIGTPAPQDRAFARGAIAFGPVYRGADIASGIKRKKLRERPEQFQRVVFGPPIIQAYLAEGTATPFGIAIHESARTFAPLGQSPMRLTHWLWWKNHEELAEPTGVPSLSSVRSQLLLSLGSHFDWMTNSLIFHNLPADKVAKWRESCRQYFSMG